MTLTDKQANQIADLIDGNSAFTTTGGNRQADDATSGEKKDKKRISQRDALIAVAKDCELWHDSNSFAYATFRVGTHRENWLIRSRRFRLWLSAEYFRAKGTAIGGTALDDGLRLLESRAINAGPNDNPFFRIGRRAGKLYLDLADDEWRAVEITRDGWTVIPDPPVRFLRTPAMRPLAEPDRGGMIEDLRRFINVHTDDDFTLTVAWLISALRDRGPYPILAVNGEQGSGKSNFCLLLRSLIDPSAAPIRVGQPFSVRRKENKRREFTPTEHRDENRQFQPVRRVQNPILRYSACDCVDSRWAVLAVGRRRTVG